MYDLGLDDNIKHSSTTAQRKVHNSQSPAPVSGGSSDNHVFVSSREGRRTSQHSRLRQSGPSVQRHTPLQVSGEVTVEGESDDESVDEKDYYKPTLWWFTNTVFPLIAGTFGPIANLFSICGLVQSWRISQPDGSRVPDPGWLLALNIVSLVLALLANLVLLFNFAKRIPYRVAQPFTIIFWYFSALFLLVPICIAHTSLLRQSSSYALSENYYYAFIACIIYFIISTLLLLNVLGASYPFYAYTPSFSQLSTPQRTLMLQTILLSAYLSLGGGIFGAIEGWEFVEGVYWADYTLLTIGLGSDFPVTKTAGRMVLIPYAALGIVFVGLIVSSVRGLVVERGKTRITKRRLQKERERWKEIIDREDVKDGEGIPDRAEARRRRIESGSDIKRFFRTRQKAQSKETCLMDHADDHRIWRKREFELMRYIEKSAKKTQGFIALGSSIFAFILVWVGGSLVFWACEEKDTQWTYPAALYFTYTSILTIGYGDFFPSTAAARPFFVIWSLIAVPTVTVLISNMGETVVHGIQEGVTWLGSKSLLPEKTSSGNKSDSKMMMDETEKGESSGGGTKFGLVRRKKKTRSTASLNRSRCTSGVKREADQTKVSATRKVSQTRTDGTQTEAEAEAGEGEVEEGTQTVEQSPAEHQEHLALSIRLSREITRVAKDASQKPPIQYTWHEWLIWLKMLDEAGETLGVISPMASRRRPPMGKLVDLARDEALQRSQTHRSCENTNVGGDRPEGSASQSEEQMGSTGDWQWTWLDDQGPLFSAESETQWVLDKLCMLLEKVIRKEVELTSDNQSNRV